MRNKDQICRFDACKENAYALTLCRTHHRRWANTRLRAYKYAGPNISKEACWLDWGGRYDWQGYPTFKIADMETASVMRTVSAMEAMMIVREDALFKVPPSGVTHMCGNLLCFNPRHGEWRTNAPRSL